ncbi:hypothetical protein LOTGIDRAFT_124539 [Lottia gigantea]|uniref:Pre-mRNA-splicing factor SLU7 n=1 Tax=Lottia gigantea TaxID=225164 RepID=V4A923_LOTGI|nr:hypothetical protein LOTGIDRAFT_124539 [Lottia gigantea]ESO89806.1 hypothetical protein LOTGIDRAFT_124539 [Lottia gigantea]
MAKSEEGDDGPKKQSREDWKKMKELDEMRKAGTAPAMQDEEGRDINPHIPQYIMQAPWYYGSTSATLKHQRPQEEKHKSYSTMNEWYKKGIKDGPVATKFRKGACENCGAMTHKKKDCLERPRKVGAKYTGESIAPDEYIQDNLDFDYEGKRDRWNGINTEEHRQKLFEEHNKIELAKRVLKEQKLDAGIEAGEGAKDEDAKDEDDAEVASDDEDKYADDMLMPGQKFETKQRITVRNLRIREDTAKYLYNLDLNSAFYDPKTRSMRQNPFENSGKDKADLHYAGDNFVRVSGDAYEMSKEQLFAWEAYERGVDVHIQADPTKLALLKKEFIQRKDTFKETAKQSILDKYGGEEHLEAPPKELLLAQTENYVEYSRHGSVIKGQEKVAIKSRYEEDVHINNHTSVWGSYWFNGQWGFSCCHSLVKESYCTGEAGKQASSSKELMLQQQKEYDAEETPKSLMEKRKKKKKKEKKKKKKKKKNKDNSDSDSSESDDSEEKLKKALKKEDAHNRDIEKLMALDERKRPYNSMFEAKEPTEEEMQAYLMKKRRLEDPMAAFLTK